MLLRSFYCIVVFLSGSLAFSSDGTYGAFNVVKGRVTVTSGKTKVTEPAKIGRKVFPGDLIETGPDSRAKIVMSDRNILNISPDTKLLIEKYSNNVSQKEVELSIQQGKVRASVHQKYDGETSKFNVKTPVAVAGVRGTDFLTSYNVATRQSQVVTFEGTVAFGKPGIGGKIMEAVYVRPGQTASAVPGRPVEAPRAIPAEQLKQINNESNGTGAPTDSSPGVSQAPIPSDKKEESKQASNDSSSASPTLNAGIPAGGDATVAAPPTGEKAPMETARAPASIAIGAPMVDARDLGPELSRDMNFQKGPNLGTNFNPPAINLPPVPVPNSFLNDVNKHQKTKLNVEIVPQ